jgi:hypothetical protein
VPDSGTSCVCLPAGRLLLGCRVKRTRKRGFEPSTDSCGTRTLEVPVRGLNGLGWPSLRAKKINGFEALCGAVAGAGKHFITDAVFTQERAGGQLL